MHYILSTLIYAQRDDEVLLMHRNKEPNLGLWVAPGGKIEVGESPREAARREMLEETGLAVDNLRLRGICSEVSPLPTWCWMLFIYTTRTFSGTLRPDLREGRLAWTSIDAYLTARPIPEADAIFGPRVLGDDPALFEARFVYDADLKLVTCIEH